MKRMSKKILVTGCNGQLGRAINKEYAGSDVTFINTDVVEGEGVTALDITKIEQVLSLVRAEQPEVIINCAAHTNVDACEKQWDAAYRINALGPRNLSKMCIRDRGIRNEDTDWIARMLIYAEQFEWYDKPFYVYRKGTRHTDCNKMCIRDSR